VPQQVAARSRSLEAIRAPLTALVPASPLAAQWSRSLRAPQMLCSALARPPQVALNSHREMLAA
ncbi:MAG TPA: hypothetical protein VGJ21_17545, partial [Terracidiphilus sp.]